MNEVFLDTIMNNDYCRILTICGSAKFRRLKEEYQAYYTIKNNLVFAPVNYLLIKNNDNVKPTEAINAEALANIHDKKILLSEAIIVVTDDKGYYGYHTQREIEFAKKNHKTILYTHIDYKDRDKYYYNYDLTYPLYMSKEDYLWD